jgi:hypothetical protein
VVVGVSFCGFLGMVGRVKRVTLRRMSVVGSGFMIPGFVMFGGFCVVLCRVSWCSAAFLWCSAPL